MMRTAVAAGLVLALAACQRPSNERAGPTNELESRTLPSNRVDHGSGPKQEVSGTLAREGADYFIVRPDGSKLRFDIARDARIEVDGRQLDPGSIPSGAEVRASYREKDGVPVVDRLEANPSR